MNSYQSTEDAQKIRTAGVYLKKRINDTLTALIMYEPGQCVNGPINVMRRDIKRACGFMPEAVKLMDAFHTDFIRYERDQTYSMLQLELQRLNDTLADLTDVPPPKPKRKYHRHKPYKVSNEISMLIEKALQPVPFEKRVRQTLARMRRKARNEKLAAAATAQ